MSHVMLCQGKKYLGHSWQLFSRATLCSSKKKKKKKETHLLNNRFMFFVLKNRKHSIFGKYLLVVFTHFLRIVLKNNYTNM